MRNINGRLDNMIMCIHCHPRDDNMISMLQSALEVPRFSNWNRTSFQHVLLAVEGHNGDEAHYIALQLGIQFCNWVAEQKEIRSTVSMLRALLEKANAAYEATRCACTVSDDSTECTTSE